MDVIIVCHTEFGQVINKRVLFDNKCSMGVEQSIPKLVHIADKYGAKITFAVMPEVTNHFPQISGHQIGLHIHPGWEEGGDGRYRWFRGDKYLRENCTQSSDSSALWNYSFKEQLEMIKAGKDCLIERFDAEPKVFVAGRWSENNDTIRALTNAGFTHDCTPPANQKSDHFDWSKLPRICMPYHPSEKDYQIKGTLPLLIVPIAQFFPRGSVSPEVGPAVGLPWIKACFLEYYRQSMPLFHIFLHSNSMIDPYYLSIMDNFLKFISVHKGITFKYASEVSDYPSMGIKVDLFPYLYRLNKNVIRTYIDAKLGISIGEKI